MELHKALRNIIQTDGPDILNDVRLINVLDDFQAYQDIPASKYILRAIISDGFTAKLLALGKWSSDVDQLANKFATITGFVPESVSVICQSIAYGLGWINAIQFNSKPSNKTSQSTSNKISKEEDLLNKIAINTSGQNGRKVVAKNFSCRINSVKSFTLFCEFHKSHPKKDGTMHYALYDFKGRILDEGYFGWVYDYEPTIVTRSKQFDFPYNNIGKIYLYWV